MLNKVLPQVCYITIDNFKYKDDSCIKKIYAHGRPTYKMTNKQRRLSYKDDLCLKMTRTAGFFAPNFPKIRSQYSKSSVKMGIFANISAIFCGIRAGRGGIFPNILAE